MSEIKDIKDIGDTEFSELLKRVDLGELNVIKFNTANGQDRSCWVVGCHLCYTNYIRDGTPVMEALVMVIKNRLGILPFFFPFGITSCLITIGSCGGLI